MCLFVRRGERTREREKDKRDIPVTSEQVFLSVCSQNSSLSVHLRAALWRQLLSPLGISCRVLDYKNNTNLPLIFQLQTVSFRRVTFDRYIKYTSVSVWVCLLWKAAENSRTFSLLDSKGCNDVPLWLETSWVSAVLLRAALTNLAHN